MKTRTLRIATTLTGALLATSFGDHGDEGARGVGTSARPPSTATEGTCAAAAFLRELGLDHLMVGASMSDASAAQAPFQARYLYLAGGLFDGAAPCASCAVDCSAQGRRCANPSGCPWWGCWQYDQLPPGAYARDFIARARRDAQIPMITYYEIRQTSGLSEGAPLVAGLQEAALLRRYLADWEFVLRQVADQRVLLHIEPDLWGYAQKVSSDPHAIPAQVRTSHPMCAAFEDDLAGLSRCMIAMVQSLAPNAKVGLHASPWATRTDVLANTDPTLDVVAEGHKLGSFLRELGAEQTDFVVVDAADRDAAWYEAHGRRAWWDATNRSLPNFTQAFRWSRAIGDSVGKPVLWWQIPVGHERLDDTRNRYRDNRLDYFFDHMHELVASGAAGVLFGAGEGQQTMPETDDGHLIARVQAYGRAPQEPCP